jgi:hypothetical protein
MSLTDWGVNQMSILNFEDGKKSKNYSKNSVSRKNSKTALGIGAIVLSVVLGSTFAASINLNSGAPVEFGQGVAMTTACDSSVFVTPYSTFVNDADDPEFKFTSFSVSEIGSECDGKVFTIKAFKDGENDALALYTTTGVTDPYKEVQVLNTAGSFSLIGAGLQISGISSFSGGFTVNLSTSGSPESSAAASALDVDRMTIESRDSTEEERSPDPDPDTETFTFTFDYNCDGCGYSSESSSTRTINAGDGIVSFPYFQTLWDDYEFVRWMWSEDSSLTETELLALTWNSDATFTADWRWIDPGPGEPQIRNVYWVDNCPTSCLPSSGGQQTYELGGDIFTITDFPSDPSASGWTFGGWGSQFSPNGDLTLTGTWTEVTGGGGGGFCEEGEPSCSP